MKASVEWSVGRSNLASQEGRSLLVMRNLDGDGAHRGAVSVPLGCPAPEDMQQMLRFGAQGCLEAGWKSTRV